MISEHVQRAVREFNPRLVMIENRFWEPGDDPDKRYAIAQKIVRRAETNYPDLPAIVSDVFPVLWLDDIHEVNEEWFHALKRNELKNLAGLKARMKEAEQKKHQALMEDVRDHAKDELHWAFKRQFDQYSFPTTRRVDPTRSKKWLEDFNGRLPR